MQAQEQRRSMREEGSMEGAFQANGVSDKRIYKPNSNETCPHCKKTGHEERKCWWRPDIKCRKCGKLGHVERVCKTQQKDEANAMIEENEEKLFVATSSVAANLSSDSWLIDSGGTNHMTNDEELFKVLDTSVTSKVRIGNGDILSVKGQGTVAIESVTGVKYIQDVLYVPQINHNLLCLKSIIIY